MTVHIYSLCWNEERMLPYYFRHYDPIADRFFVYDDSSTDNSLSLLAANPKVEVRRFVKREDSFVASARQLHNEAWKESRGKADWVILCSMDEHLHHPDLPQYLRECQAAGITAIPSRGYQMVGDSFPDIEGRLCDRITRGVPWPPMDKIAVFNPDAIDEINYAPGRHSATPAGRVIYPRRHVLLLLHYKYVGLDYLVSRSAELQTGLRRGDIEKKWGEEYSWNREKIEASFLQLRAAASDLPRVETGRTVRGQWGIEQWWRERNRTLNRQRRGDAE